MISIILDLLYQTTYTEQHERSTLLYPFARIDDGAPTPEEPIVSLVNLSISPTKKYTLPLTPSGIGDEKVPVDPWHISGITKLIMASQGTCQGYGTDKSELFRFQFDNDILPQGPASTQNGDPSIINNEVNSNILILMPTVRVNDVNPTSLRRFRIMYDPVFASSCLKRVVELLVLHYR